jgi:DNA-binding transcriptional ArsR family regulator
MGFSISNHIADRQAGFSETANALKARLDKVRITCFGLSVGGATLAAVAGGLPNDTYRSYLAWPAAAMLAVGAFVTARLLSKDSVTLHIKARMASEALKREAFLYATGAKPYDVVAKRDDLLKLALDNVEKNAEGLGLYEQKAASLGSCPRESLNAAGYLAKRLDGQIGYYQKSAEKLTRPSRILHIAEFVLAGAAAVITAVAASVGKGSFDLAALTAVITTLAGTVFAHLQAARYDELIISYRATAHRLANLRAVTAPSASAADIALAAEEVIASETNSWQALWLKEKSG